MTSSKIKRTSCVLYGYRCSSFTRITPFDTKCVKSLVYIKINVGIAASSIAQLFSIFNISLLSVSLVSDKILILKFIKITAKEFDIIYLN